MHTLDLGRKGHSLELDRKGHSLELGRKGHSQELGSKGHSLYSDSCYCSHSFKLGRFAVNYNFNWH